MIRYSFFYKLPKTEVSFSIGPAVFLAGGWAEPRTMTVISLETCLWNLPLKISSCRHTGELFPNLPKCSIPT